MSVKDTLPRASGRSDAGFAGRPAISLAFLTAIAAFNTIDRQVLAILAAPMKAEFLLTDAQVGLLGLVYGVLYSVCAAPLAALANRTSRRAVIVACMMCFSLFTAFCGIAWNYATLLISRVGVALGEAGTAAPSQSIIADLYPRERRTLALSIFSVASKPGGFVAFVAGGWFAEWFGWRATFLLLGVPGILLACATWLALREPAPGASDARTPAADSNLLPGLWASLCGLSHVPSFWHILIGQGLWSLFTLGLVFWMPQYLHRSFGLDLGIIGTAMGIYTLGLGAVGVLTIGWITQKLQVKDVRWILGVPAVAAAIALPCIWIALTSSSIWTLALCALVVVFVYSTNLGPAASATQSVAPTNMRTIAAGCTQVMLGFLGMGLGPFLPGVLSDALEPIYGTDSLGYSLILMSMLWPWAAFHFFLANRTIARDIARAEGVADLPRVSTPPV